MLLGFNVKEIEIVGVINIIEIVITENGNEVVNGDAETSAALSAYNMVLRIRTKERNDLSNIVKSIRRNLSRDRIKTAQIFCGKNVTGL